MKKIKIILLALVTFMVSCDSDLDIKDPNNPTDVSYAYQLTTGEVAIAVHTAGGLMNLGGYWSQHYTQAPSASQYLNMDSYAPGTDALDREWNSIYDTGIQELEDVRTKATEAGDTQAYLIATLMRAHTYQILVDLFGSVAYSEAIIETYPSFDEGKDIYPQLISSIDEAVSRYNANPTSSSEVDNADLVLGGDMDQWLKFANSLKLKLYVKLADTSLANASEVQGLLSSNNFITTDLKYDNFADVEEKRNPFYEVQIDRLGDVNHVASSSLATYLDENGDSRLDAIYRVGSGGTHVSIPQGSRSNYSGLASDYSRPNITFETPAYIMAVSESEFLKAEADLRYNGGTNAKTYYDAAIEASFSTLGAGSSTSFTTTGGVYEYPNTGVLSTDLEQIMIQKWVALANVNAIEAFSEINRTGFPAIEVYNGSNDYSVGILTYPVNSAIGNNYPKSFWYPNIELSRNPNAPTQKSNLLQKVFWDVN